MAISSSKLLPAIIAAVLLVCAASLFLTMPDRRTTGQRVGDAIDALPQGVDKATEQFERRTPGEKLGDKVKDAGDDIKKSTSNQK